MCCAPETSFLVVIIITLDQQRKDLPTGTKKAKIKQAIQAYALIKYPASERHFTLVVGGSRDLKLSQCKMELNPPAEQPERIACTSNIRLDPLEGYLYRLWYVLCSNKEESSVHTFFAFFIPLASRLLMIARKTLAPLKCRLVAWSKVSSLYFRNGKGGVEFIHSHHIGR